MQESSREVVVVPLVDVLRIAAMAAEVRACLVEGRLLLQTPHHRPLDELAREATRTLGDGDDMALALTETLRSALRSAGRP